MRWNMAAQHQPVLNKPATHLLVGHVGHIHILLASSIYAPRVVHDKRALKEVILRGGFWLPCWRRLLRKFKTDTVVQGLALFLAFIECVCQRMAHLEADVLVGVQQAALAEDNQVHGLHFSLGLGLGFT